MKNKNRKFPYSRKKLLRDLVLIANHNAKKTKKIVAKKCHSCAEPVEHRRHSLCFQCSGAERPRKMAI